VLGVYRGNFSNKNVIVRVDWNLSLTGDEKSHRDVKDVSKIMENVTTINHLFKHGARTVHIITHQGRPGKSDFTSTRIHSDILSRALRPYHINVKYVGDFDKGLDNLESCLKDQRNGYVYVWDNIRKLDDETKAFEDIDLLDKNIQVDKVLEEKMSKIPIVKLILKYFDPKTTAYVNDAFATNHRINQLSIGPLGKYLMNNGYEFFYGPTFNDELAKINLLKKEMDASEINFFFGGAKIEDYVKLMPKMLEKYPTSHVFASGPLALALLKYGENKEIGDMNLKLIKEVEGNDMGQKLGDAYNKYKSRIHLPSSFMVVESGQEPVNGNEVEKDTDSLHGTFVVDIGNKTVEDYERMLKIRHSAVNLINGGCGFHQGGFVCGTVKIFEHTRENGSFVAVVGGDANLMWNKHATEISEPDVRSTAGKAFLNAIVKDEIDLKKFLGI
jgi:phosphoglycerate kinase